MSAASGISCSIYYSLKLKKHFSNNDNTKQSNNEADKFSVTIIKYATWIRKNYNTVKFQSGISIVQLSIGIICILSVIIGPLCIMLLMLIFPSVKAYTLHVMITLQD